MYSVGYSKKGEMILTLTFSKTENEPGMWEITRKSLICLARILHKANGNI